MSATDPAALVDAFVQATRNNFRTWPRPDVREIPEYTALVEAPPQVRAEAVVVMIGRMCQGIGHDGSATREVTTRLLRAKLQFDEHQVSRMATSMFTEANPWAVPYGSVLRGIERYRDEHGLSETHKAALRKVRMLLSQALYADLTKHAPRIDALVGDLVVEHAPSVSPGAWGDPICSWLLTLEPEKNATWSALFRHASSAASKARPTAKWLKQATGLVKAVDDDVAALVTEWLRAAKPGPNVDGIQPADMWMIDSFPEADRTGTLAPANIDLVKGLVWMASVIEDDRLTAEVGRFGQRCFRKVRNYGAKSTKLGNACLVALGNVPDGGGVVHLSGLMTRVRYPSARKQIEKALNNAAERAGVSRQDLEEMAIPSYELTIDGFREVPMADVTARLEISGVRGTGAKGTLIWLKGDGKTQKSIPATVKESHADDIKQLKQDLKELNATLATQAARIERLWLTRTEPWAYRVFAERYLDHPVVSCVARSLIWIIEDQPVLWNDGALRTVDGTAQTPAETDRVRLWHPIESSTNEVLAWRDLLEEIGLIQAFKQAWREVYLLTPAEEETEHYSNRFAAHIIRQHPFLALCQQRDWRYTIQGPWDSANTPIRTIPAWNLQVEYWVEPAIDIGHEHHSGYTHLTTDQVRFARGAAVVPVAQVPALPFSELMRDVDLFVSVCSIGNDPTWQDGRDHHAYWHDYSFGELSETAKTRAAVLERLVPRLKIRDVAKVEGRFLVVKGKLKAYKIHLGSANIQMNPGGYLCIVPDRRNNAAKRVVLPFTGDDLMAVILSKAFMLADDDKIKDPSIVAQINR